MSYSDDYEGVVKRPSEGIYDITNGKDKSASLKFPVVLLRMYYLLTV